MRLLNLATGALEYIPDQPYPPYAILSHTWGPTGTEITFADMEAGKEEVKLASFEKMRNTCLRAKEDGIGHVWIDNFCINKDSSAELSESINAMYNWYRDAEVCYAYMSDVPAGEYPNHSTYFAESRWFRRGWTLQELIAPREVIFFSQNWTKLGTRSSLSNVISGITKIDKGILTKRQDLKHVSVSKRMSWAADRQTTRQEDAAYCLMGLFNVNMPMLYGEGGEKAFRRLQEEIMKESDDQTLFAWKTLDLADISLRGLLAKSPQEFRDSSAYIPNSEQQIEFPHVPTSRGIRITLGLSHLEDDIYIGSLHCPAPPNCELGLGIYLRILDEATQQYARTKADKFFHVPYGTKPQTIYVRQQPLVPGFDAVFRHHAFQLSCIRLRSISERRLQNCLAGGYKVLRVIRNPRSDAVPPLPRRSPDGIPMAVFEIHKSSTQVAGAIVIFRPPSTYIAVVLGSKSGFGVGARVLDITHEVLSNAEYSQFMQNSVRSPKFYHVEGEMFKRLSLDFAPQSPGHWFDFTYERYSVSFIPKVHTGIQYYLTIIDIEELMPGVSQSDSVTSASSDTVQKGGLWKRVRSFGQ